MPKHIFLVAFLILGAASALPAEPQQPLTTFETSGGALSLSSDGKLLAVGADYKGPLKVFDLNKQTELATLESVEGTYASVSLSPNGKLLAAVRITLDPPENNLSVWDVAARKRLWETKEGVMWAKFSLDGKSLLVGGYQQFRFFDPKSGRGLRSVPAHRDSSVDLGEFSASGKWFVTAGEDDKQIIVWNVQTGKTRQVIQLTQEPTATAISDDGSLVAIAQNTKVAVFDTTTGREKWSKTPHEEAVRSLSFRPTTLQFVSGSQDGSVRIWDAATGEELEGFRPERGMVQAVLYTPSGGSLIVGTSGATLVYSAGLSAPEAGYRLWQSASGKFRVEARLIGQADDKVRLLRKSDNKEVEVPLAQLSDADRQFAAEAWQASSARPGMLRYESESFAWKLGDKPVSLLSVKSGIAILAEVSGNFGGYAEKVEVVLTQNGRWQLSGQAPDSYVVAKALTLKDFDPALFSDDVKEFTWTKGQEPVRMLKAEEGVCFLAGISGALRGYGEHVRVRLADDGYWYLEGTSAQPELSAKAIAVRWKDATTIKTEVTDHSWTQGEGQVELLAAKDGLCMLGELSGNFAGGGEIVRLTLEDGTWYLGGQSGQEELSARALIVRIRRGN